MSDSETDPLNSLLSSFALGPAWARAAGNGLQERSPKKEFKSDDRPPRRDDRRDENRGGPRGRDRDRDDGRKFQGRGPRRDDARSGPPRQEEAAPPEGVRVTLVPDAQAVHLIGKEVHQVARVYPLFDVAKILLAERGRCRAVFESQEPAGPLFVGKKEDSVFLTREDALNHLWNSDLRATFLEEETIETDPPAGNYQLVAKCGLSGVWLGPPNFHAYQVNLRRVHRERYPHMPFAAYSARVRTERGEEAVNAWLETMKKKTRWRIKGDGDDAWIEDLNEARRALAARCFDEAFTEARRAEVLASIPAANLSASLMTSLKMAGNHARNHPAILIPAVCKAVEAEHLPVFKRQGKLFTGPARPHPLPPGQALAERPAIMVEWIRANKPAKLEGLWKAVLPEGSTAPPAEFAADLFWLLHQGHILLFTDDTLVVQEIREAQADTPAPGEGKSRKKKMKKKPATAGDSPAPPDDDSAPSTADADESSDTPSLISTEDSAPVEGNSETTAPEEQAAVPVTESTPQAEPECSDPKELSPNPSTGVDEPSSL